MLRTAARRMTYAIGIDLGINSLKAVLLDDQGNTVAASCAGYPLLKLQPTWREQNPDEWWDALCRTAGECLESIYSTDVRGALRANQWDCLR